MELIANIFGFYFTLFFNCVSFLASQNYDSTVLNEVNRTDEKENLTKEELNNNKILALKEEPAWLRSGDIDGVDEVLLKQLSDPNVQFNALKNHQLIWPNGIVPYELDEAFSISEVKLLQKAFRIYRRRTFGCIHFKPRNFENDYLNIVRGNGCYSQVGKTGGKQELSLGQGCLFNETIIHELMHSLGFWHEHSRADRDNHIIIRWENILPGLDSQFDIFTNIIGTSFELSELDIEKIMKLYNCDKQKKGNKCTDYFVDCNQFIDYCRKISFYFIMRTYCPFTCGKCKK
ncbi:unnamed protein product [Meloidogyne enterolobii]|uniref:Uncharacterized protein n=1 Tax=Meloidogyne enterolobii TaxID=390850 RepID=A0ACB0Y4K4_MELEN